MSAVNTFAKVQAIDKEFTPKEGYNLVGCDTFELPGEGFYLVGNYPTFDQARDAAKETDDPTSVVGPDGDWVTV